MSLCPCVPAHAPLPAGSVLRAWVGSVFGRFALEARVVRPCWYRHNARVEALSALRDHERICFAPNASPTAAVDWFWGLREVEHRMSEACARTQCSVNEHRPDPPRAWTTDQGPWQRFVDADVAERERRVIDQGLAGG